MPHAVLCLCTKFQEGNKLSCVLVPQRQKKPRMASDGTRCPGACTKTTQGAHGCASQAWPFHEAGTFSNKPPPPQALCHSNIKIGRAHV